MKKQLCTVLTAAMLVSGGTLALANETKMPSVVVNDTALTLDQAPIITAEDRVMVPMRAIFEALGATVEWNSETSSVLATADTREIALTVGETALTINDQDTLMDTAAQILEGRVLVPVRAVSEAFDASVDWNSDTKVVTIATKAETTTPVESPEAGTLTITEKTLAEKGDNYALKITYPQISNTDNNEVIAQLNAQFEQAAKDFITENKAEALNGEAGIYQYVAEQQYEITFDDGIYLSVLNTNIINAGGAHPMTYKNSAVYSLNDGKTVALNAILNGTDSEINAKVTAGFEALINKTPELFFESAKDDLAEAMQMMQYYLTKDGLEFYLPLYSLQPYAAGFTQFNLDYNSDDFKINL